MGVKKVVLYIEFFFGTLIILVKIFKRILKKKKEVQQKCLP